MRNLEHWKFNLPRSELIFFSILFLSTFLLYMGSLPKEFTNWDDPKYVVENHLIRSLNYRNLLTILTAPYFSNYAPLTLISYAMDFSLWRLNATGYYFHNVLLHLCCVFLTYWLLKRMGIFPPALFIAVGLFALHPTDLESVGWISERKNLLATLFFLASLLAYVRYTQSKCRTDYLLAVLCFPLSLLSKASVVTGPALLLLYDYLQGSRKIKELRLYDKLPFLGMAEIMSFWAIYSAQAENALRTYHQQGPWLNLVAAPQLVFEYLQLLFFPYNISATYLEHGELTWHSPLMWVYLALLFSLGLVLWRVSPRSLFWLCFFLVLILPVLNIIPLPIKMSNRYLYLPQIGIWVLFSQLLIFLYSRLDQLKLLRVVSLVSFSLWVVWISSQTYGVAKVWRNSETLWKDALEKDFFNSTAHYNLGLYYLERGPINLGGLHLMLAVQINPSYPSAHNGLGHYFLLKNLPDQAITQFNKALALEPDFDQALNNLGKALADKGNSQKALLMFYRATYVNPDNRNAFLNILTFHVKAKQWDAAKNMAIQTILRFPYEAKGYAVYAEASEQLGDLHEALRGWQEYSSRAEISPALRSQVESKIKQLRDKSSSLQLK